MGCVSRSEAKLGQNLSWGLPALWKPIVLSMAPLLILASTRVALPSFLEPGLRLIAVTPGASLSGQPHTGGLLLRPFFLPPFHGAQGREGKSLAGLCCLSRGLDSPWERLWPLQGQIRFLLTSFPLLGDKWWAGLELGTPLCS